jgi:hypothetical protein
MKRSLKSGYLALMAGLVISQCASISNLSTARPVGRGESRVTVGLSKITTKSDTIPIIESIPDFVFFELMGTAGITDRFDISLKYTFPTAGYFEANYCLLMNNPETGLFFSPALRAGYTAFPHDADSAENNRVEISVPLYLSYFPAKAFGITLAPVYSGRFFLRGEYRITQLAGGMLSVSIGSKIGVIIEGDYLYNFYWKWHEIQGGAALVVPVKSIF